MKAPAPIIERSGAVFFAGGNQADYVVWKDTPIQSAVQDVYGRGGVVGGTSAGEAILGEYVFDAVAEGDRDTTTDNAVQHPWERIISFTYNFLKFPALADAITAQWWKRSAYRRNRCGSPAPPDRSATHQDYRAQIRSRLTPLCRRSTPRSLALSPRKAPYEDVASFGTLKACTSMKTSFTMGNLSRIAPSTP